MEDRMQYGLKLALLLIPVIVFLFYFTQIKKPSLFVFANIYLILIIGITLFRMGEYVYTNYHQPPLWDFLGFWLNGSVGISGENFYNGENYREIVLPYNPGDEFREEIIDTGFWYPPFSMFLFLPLGLFDISIAYLFWQISNILFCVACIYGLWKLFLRNHGVISLLLIAVLMLRLDPTRSTFSFAQTNFLALLFFLFFWQSRTKGWGGIWLALCVVVKPFMAFLYIYPLLTRKWKLLISAILTLLVLTSLSVLVFGLDVFVSYMNNPIPDTPSWNYIEITNQSLLATILRLTKYQITDESPILNQLYLGISLVLTFVTVLVTVKNRNNNDDDWITLSILFLALLVYPANQMFYSVFLIIPVVLLLRQSSQSIKERITIFFIILITYFLSGYDDHMFFVNLFMWLVCIVLGAKSNIEKNTRTRL